ncbi:Isochorismatase-like protein, partial [Mycena maculata]
LRGTHAFKIPCCEPNSVGAAFPESFAALLERQELVLMKKWYSVFTDTTLRNELTVRGITHLYIGGLLTNICVQASAVDA